MSILFPAVWAGFPEVATSENASAKVLPAGSTNLLQSDMLGVARYFSEKVLPATSGGGSPGESASLSAVRHIFGAEPEIGLSYTDDLTIPATAPFKATPTVWANHFLASSMFWYRLEAGLLIFKQVSKEDTKWLSAAAHYFELLGNAKFTLSMFNTMQVAFLEGKEATGWPAKVAAWAKLRMAYFTTVYVFAKTNAALIALQTLLHTDGAEHVEKLTNSWKEPFDGFASQMKKMFSEWYTTWGKMLGISPEKTAEHLESFSSYNAGENLVKSSFRWSNHAALWAFQHWMGAGDLGVWALLVDGKAWDASKWHKFLELRTMKWLGMVAKFISMVHLTPESFPMHKLAEMWMPWQGMYVTYMGSAIAYHNHMAAKTATATTQVAASKLVEQKADKIL